MRMHHEVSIEGADNGIIIRVGCKKFVFKDAEEDEFISDLRLLLFGGSKADRELRKKYLGEVECNENLAYCDGPRWLQSAHLATVNL